MLAAQRMAILFAGGARAPLPANYDFIMFGDSRGEFGDTATLTSSNYGQTTFNTGVQTWLTTLSGGRLRLGRYSNLSIASGTAVQAAASPRLSKYNDTYPPTTLAINAQATPAGNAANPEWWRGITSRGAVGNQETASGPANKGITQAAAHAGGFVIILLGGNDVTADINSIKPGGSARTAMQTILAGLTGKTVILLDELPRGVSTTGASVASLGTNATFWKAYSTWLKTFDYASGDANAQSNVIAVNSFEAILDTATIPVADGGTYVGSNPYTNLQGSLRDDGLHLSAYGAYLVAQAIVTRLSTVWGGTYTALPNRSILPTANNIASFGTAAPYLNLNPILTPGTNGAVGGTWTSAPTAATIPQGWTITGSNLTGFTGVADKTQTGDDGMPMWTITVSGTLAAATAGTIQLTQTLSAGNLTTLISGGFLTLADRIRGLIRYKVASSSAYLTGVNVQFVVGTDTTAKNMVVTEQSAGNQNVQSQWNAGGESASDQWLVAQSHVMDLAEPFMQAGAGGPGAIVSLSSLQSLSNITFFNPTAGTVNVAGTIYISKLGVYVSRTYG